MSEENLFEELVKITSGFAEFYNWIIVQNLDALRNTEKLQEQRDTMALPMYVAKLGVLKGKAETLDEIRTELSGLFVKLGIELEEQE